MKKNNTYTDMILKIVMLLARLYKIFMYLPLIGPTHLFSKQKTRGNYSQYHLIVTAFNYLF